MQRHVPDDVWMYIAESLPQDHLRTLYAVNRAFLHTGMNARYHTVLLSTLDINTFKLIIRLQDEYVTKRVCRVEFQPLLFPYDHLKSLNQASQAFSKEVQQRIPRLIPHDFDWSNPEQEIYRYIRRAITSMRAVTSCTWAFTPRYALTIGLPPNSFHDLPSLFCHLEQLELYSPLLKPAHGLKSTHFPRLRELIIHDDSRRSLDAYATNEPPVIGFIASFISGFNTTLTRLKILSQYDLFPLFLDKLGYFHQLTKLELSVRSIDPSFIRFLTRHAATLKFLALDVDRDEMENVKAAPILQTVCQWHTFTADSTFEFPRLQTLELALPFPTSSQSMTLATWIRPFVDTLTTLVLKEQFISTGDLDIALSAFSRNRGVLTSASLDLEKLSPRTVDLFANNCLALTDLKLSVLAITGVDDHSELGFYREMEGCAYPQWPLRNIVITIRHSFLCFHVKPREILCWRAMALFSKLVPSIKSFNDQGDLRIPDGMAERNALEEMMSVRGCSCSEYD